MCIPFATDFASTLWAHSAPKHYVYGIAETRRGNRRPAYAITLSAIVGILSGNVRRSAPGGLEVDDRLTAAFQTSI
jgi:hypothetical protein